MATASMSREEVSTLACRVKDGDNEAFKKLERVAYPLLASMANKFSNKHDDFEYDDFYQLCLLAMYDACMKYDAGNPSFLSYARVFMINVCSKQIQHWSQSKRNIFKNAKVEISYANKVSELVAEDEMFEEVFKSQFREQVEGIISLNFDGNKAAILRMHILDDKKVCDIADELGLKYKNVYSVTTRGTEEIKQKYTEMYLSP